MVMSCECLADREPALTGEISSLVFPSMLRPVVQALWKKAQQSLDARIANAANAPAAAPAMRSHYNTTSVRRAPAPMRGRAVARPTVQRR